MEIEGIGEEVAEGVADDDEEEEEENDDERCDDSVENNISPQVDKSISATSQTKKVLHLKNVRTKRGTPRLQEGSPGSLDEIDSVYVG